MFTVLRVFFYNHDLRLAVLAAVVCAVASFAAMTLLHHARKSEGAMQRVWLVTAAVATGTGIWATHFIAMISFNPGLPLGYDLGLTVLSLVIAIVVPGAGLWLAGTGNRRSDAAVGGGVVGLGISAMHFTGMASLVVGGNIDWDPTLVAASIVLGAVLGAVAIPAGLHKGTIGWKSIGAGLLTVAICTMHFTAMGAAGFANCYALVSGNGMMSALMPIATAGASLFIIITAMTGVYLDVRDRRRTAVEAERMRGLANAAVEGLVVCDGARIVTVNDSFRTLIGARTDLVGRQVTDFLANAALTELRAAPERIVETEIATMAGETVPVEAILRAVVYEGHEQHAIAFRDLRARKQAEQYIRFLAHHDALTGLPNRASFAQQLEREINSARRHGTRLAVLCLDLDRFKEVNDLFGHAAGDALLERTGQCLNEAITGSQVAARLGGDEFAVLLPEIEGPTEAGRIAEKILKAFAAANSNTQRGAALGGSIGIALYPDNAGDGAELMTNADTALYRAKQDGRGTYCYFENKMGMEVHERRRLEHDLRMALAREELALVYQPQVNLDTGAVTGFEALLRWNHPERGPVSPGMFVPLAEESGLILQIGEWVLETACREAAHWDNPLTIAVNVSTVQLHSRDFAENLHKLLRATGLSPRRLELEITETALVKDMARTLATLGQLKALGVRIAMDDFGTGYSSLSNLRAFNFDKIKVDQSFIHGLDGSDQSATIVRAVLGLGKGLNLPVLAEGVERIEELDFLKGEVCAEGQGYFLGRPADIGTFSDYTHGDAAWTAPAAGTRPHKAKA